VIDGFGEIGGTNVGDDGTILVQGGLLTLNTVVSGTGTLAIASGASVDAQQALRVAHVVFGDAEFGAGGGQLMVTSADAISGTVYQFGVGGGFDDSIDLRGVSATKLQFAGGVLSISDHGSLIGTIAFAGDYSSASFGLSPDGLSGTDISFVMAASSVSMGAAQPEQHNIVAGAWSAWHPGAGLELGGLGIGPVHIPGY